MAALGALPAWLCLVAAAACLLGAVARPRGTATAIGRAGVDIVVLADASASMHVQDVAGGRWSRAMTFLRRLGDALSWDDDRMALAAFAHIATPQIRLTRDPTTVFFFLDHLGARPPYRLEDDTTWNTDLEQAIAWGLRILEKDEELHGVSPNAQVFLMLSDGEAWSGQVAKSIDRARDARVPVFVVGVGTLAGDWLPQIPQPPGEPPVPHAISRLNRASLQRIADTRRRPLLRARSRRRSGHRQRDHRHQPPPGPAEAGRAGGDRVLPAAARRGRRARRARAALRAGTDRTVAAVRAGGAGAGRRHPRPGLRQGPGPSARRASGEWRR